MSNLFTCSGCSSGTTLKRGGPRLWIGAALTALLVLAALLAPMLAPHDPLEQAGDRVEHLLILRRHAGQSVTVHAKNGSIGLPGPVGAEV